MVLPITTGGSFAKIAGFIVELVGTRTVGVVCCYQLRVLDLSGRNVKKLESILANVMGEVLAIFAIFIA